MKHFLIAAALLLGSFSAFAQAPMEVCNNTSCAYRVTGFVYADATCTTVCTDGSYCVLPNSCVTLPGCSSPLEEWDFVRVTPANDDCSLCTIIPVTVGSPAGCSGFATSVLNNVHCGSGCSNYDLDFLASTYLEIN